jgi:hypothetical protein
MATALLAETYAERLLFLLISEKRKIEKSASQQEEQKLKPSSPQAIPTLIAKLGPWVSPTVFLRMNAMQRCLNNRSHIVSNQIGHAYTQPFSSLFPLIPFIF